ncbi:hypothetical protein, partial [Pseudomonas syringae]|uniref:hypothetical protein n=1 Tax=Pseudomonas syringae TaxID=317 RepID=UPI000516C596
VNSIAGLPGVLRFRPGKTETLTANVKQIKLQTFRPWSGCGHSLIDLHLFITPDTRCRGKPWLGMC